MTVEEGAVGGFGSHVMHFLVNEGLLDNGLKVRSLVLPDVWMDQAKPETMYAKAGLDAAGILKTVFCGAGQDVPGVIAAASDKPMQDRTVEALDYRNRSLRAVQITSSSNTGDGAPHPSHLHCC